MTLLAALLLLCLAATSCYASLVLVLAGRVRDSERLLFAVERPWRWPLSRKPREGRMHTKDDGPAPGEPEADPDPPPLAEALMVFVLVMALVVLAGQPLQAWNLIFGLSVTEWLLVALPPLMLLRLGGSNALTTLRIKRPEPRTLLGGVLVASSAWYVVGALVEKLQQPFLPMPKALIEQMHRLLFASHRPFLLDLFALALSPAICEEVLFRGLLLRSAEKRIGAGWAVVLSSLLFGLFHLSIYRFGSTALLGALLALVVLRSGSIVVGMLFHLINNSIALAVGRAMGPTVTPHIDPWLLVLALALTLFGTYLTRARERQK